MAYATIAQLQARVQNMDLRELTARAESESGGVMVGSVVQRALDDASTEMDSALSARYALPIPADNPDCVRVCCILARANLYSWAGNNSELIDAETKKAREWLKLVALGTYNIVGATPISTGSKGGSSVVAPPTVFGDSFLSMYA